MKTKSHSTQSAPGLRDRSGNHQSNTAPAGQTPQRPPLPRISFLRRRANRALPTAQLVAVLRTEAPRFYELAEVVGRWVWIQFRERQPRQVTAALAELGFHWNNARQAWQHPCGTLAERAPYDPHTRYRCYFPADTQPV